MSRVDSALVSSTRTVIRGRSGEPGIGLRSSRIILMKASIPNGLPSSAGTNVRTGGQSGDEDLRGTQTAGVNNVRDDQVIELGTSGTASPAQTASLPHGDTKILKGCCHKAESCVVYIT
jgi:hypothetical protein